MPFTSYPDKYAAATLAYSTASAQNLKTVFNNPSSSQVVNPLATPTIKVFKPSTVITLNFDIATTYVVPQAYIPTRGVSYTTNAAATGYMWFVEFVPNVSGQALNFGVSLPASGTTLVWENGSTPTAPTTYAVYHFYTLDGVNVKGKVLVNY